MPTLFSLPYFHVKFISKKITLVKILLSEIIILSDDGNLPILYRSGELVKFQKNVFVDWSSSDNINCRFKVDQLLKRWANLTQEDSASAIPPQQARINNNK